MQHNSTENTAKYGSAHAHTQRWVNVTAGMYLRASIARNVASCDRSMSDTSLACFSAICRNIVPARCFNNSSCIC